MSEEKAKPMEYWLVRDVRLNIWRVSEVKVKWSDVNLGDEKRHVVEIQALRDAEARIKELEAKLWVAKDNSLRTYDGMAEKADKYDEAKEMMEKMAVALKKISDPRKQRDMSQLASNPPRNGAVYDIQLISIGALKEYEEWKRK